MRRGFHLLSNADEYRQGKLFSTHWLHAFDYVFVAGSKKVAWLRSD